MNFIASLLLIWQTFMLGQEFSLNLAPEQPITITITGHVDGSVTVVSTPPVPPPPPPPACGPCLSATPASLPHGATITGTWTGVTGPDGTDWMSIAIPGSTDFQFVGWSYIFPPQVNGSIGLTIVGGIPSGTYELRYFRADRFIRAATSNTFVVQ